jgi:carbon-monoxide dehydrogenase medium subunit
MLIKKSFHYLSPRTLKEALRLLDRYSEDSKIICGGQSLLILMKQGLVAPQYLIDVKGIAELSYIKQEDKRELLIGASTTHREIELSPLIRKNCPILSETETRLASLETRNWGTIGGNLCHADPAGDLAPVLLALGAKVKLSSLKGDRLLHLQDFTTGYYETALLHEELLIEIQVPPHRNTGIAYEKFTVTKNDYATVSTAVAITLNNRTGICSEVRVVLGAVAPTPMRAKRAEEVLLGKSLSPDLFEKAAVLAAEEAEPVRDMLASEEFKRQLIQSLVSRVSLRAYERAQKVK